MRKKVKIAVIALIGALLALVLYVLDQHSYRMIERAVVIDTPQGRLAGTLALPENGSGKFGLVVFVHGDGPIDDSYNDGYKPLWEKFASVGYASLSLDKPGIGGSSGHWLEQSMEDRAQEIVHAIEWARSLPEIDERFIGLWGASQAGWVIPKIVEKEPTLAFSILVSPAVNWISQGQYNTRAEMLRDGRTEDEIEEREAYNARIVQLLERGSSYEEYLKLAAPDRLLSRDRWAFIARNFRSDASDELTRFTSPILLVLGGQDINVDVEETESVYREKLPPGLLSLSYFPDADHSMLRKRYASSEFSAYWAAIFSPRKLVVDGYAEELAQFVSRFHPLLPSARLQP
ncbi:alpha/beta hydrolase family protein [Cohnella boryungensis]|uniref:Alpha/beta hydrolase family protein n=1 Tax=Cohnella boryungensis TaxID=768479 RepID=A0ABV8SED4_9BACL